MQKKTVIAMVVGLGLSVSGLQTALAQEGTLGVVKLNAAQQQAAGKVEEGSHAKINKVRAKINKVRESLMNKAKANSCCKKKCNSSKTEKCDCDAKKCAEDGAKSVVEGRHCASGKCNGAH